MTLFTLTIVDDTHSILTCEQALSVEQTERLGRAFERWQANGGTAIMTECLVRDERTMSVELDTAKPQIYDSSPESMASASDSLRETLTRQKIRSGPRVCNHVGIGLPGCPTCSPHHPYADEINHGGEGGEGS